MEWPRFIDVFAGCGGLSLGLARAGWRGVFGVERHPQAFQTLKHNLIDGEHGHYDWPEWLPVAPHVLEELIDEFSERLIQLRGSVDLVAGGPPCQGFSTAGRRNPQDPRNKMVQQYLGFIELVQPAMILIENVRGFTTMQVGQGFEKSYSDYVISELNRLGYDVWTTVLIASDWGVPQRRPRFFVIGIKRNLVGGVDPFLRLRVMRKAFLESKGLSTDHPVSSEMAISDLETAAGALIPCEDGGVRGFQQLDYHEPEILSAFQRLMREGATAAPDGLRLPRHSAPIRDRFETILSTCKPGRHLSQKDRSKFDSQKRTLTPLAAHLPSCTITTLPDDILHYSEPRILTVRECARLQSFPDWFSFRGPYTTGGPRRRESCPRYTQVGNAVPPLLAEAIGIMLARIWSHLGTDDRADRPDIAEVDRHVFA